MSETERGFSFLKVNDRPPKPRTRGVTEIRGPYYTLMGKRYLEDILETMGDYVDALKFAAGSFTLMPRQAVRDLIETAHRHDVLVSTGGFIEYVLTQGAPAVEQYIKECKEMWIRHHRSIERVHHDSDRRLAARWSTRCIARA